MKAKKLYKKTCAKCNKYLDSSYFFADNGRKDGLQSWCKGCNSDWWTDNYKLWSLTHCQRMRNAMMKRVREAKERVGTSKEKENDKDAYFDTSITKYYIQRLVKDKTHCPYLNLKFELNATTGNKEGRSGTPNSPSMDKIDNKLWYRKGNLEVISFQANSMKGASTKKEQLTFASSIFYKTNTSILKVLWSLIKRRYFK